MLSKFAVFALFASLSLTPAALAAQSFTGVVTDSMCGVKHMMPGRSDAQCVQECVKAGSKYELVVGTKTYTLSSKPEKIAPFAGQHVRVEGMLKGATLDVQSIHGVEAH